ncbi:MAG: 4Fe-4S dicluster domain-containing protein [Bacteroidales bacterium]|nr:4Fe-4S dicluster domain-containing protein [Bacteroidales bacterium]
MAKYGMAIDLHKCVGCGACALACKTENNTEIEKEGEKYDWADFLTFTEGTFAQRNLKHKVYPVLCNHCSDAPCVETCPVTPKAMFKTEDGITMHNDELCIGCQLCQAKCPYSSLDIRYEGKQYSVISYNPYDENTQSFYDDETAVIPNGTSTPAEVADAAGVIPPDINEYTHPEYSAIRRPDVTEKCIFCDHRLKNNELPFCVVSCPSNARIFGDLDDPQSEINTVLAAGYVRLRNSKGELLDPNEQGTDPNVFYIGDASVGISEPGNSTREYKKMKVYPNPASGNTKAEFELSRETAVDFSIYNISGKEVMKVVENERKLSGKQTIDFNVARLKAGTYIARLKTKNKAYTANIVVVNR